MTRRLHGIRAREPVYREFLQAAKGNVVGKAAKLQVSAARLRSYIIAHFQIHSLY